MASRRKTSNKPKRVVAHATEERATRAIELICEGHHSGQVIKLLRSEFDLSPALAREVLVRADEILLEIHTKRRNEALAQSLEKHQHLYRKAYTEGDWALCLKVQGCIDKLSGLQDRFTVADLIRVMEAEAKLIGQHHSRKPTATEPSEGAPAGKGTSPAETADEVVAAAKKSPKELLKLMAAGG